MIKTWFITGASSGFGRRMTEKLLARGDRVAATVRRPQTLEVLCGEHGDRLWIAKLDLTETDAVRATVDRAFAGLGRIDVIVSNAGYGLFGAAEEPTDAQVRHQIDTNLVGSITLTPRCRTCARKAAGVSCRSRLRADRSPIRVSASITRPRGVSRASSRRSPREVAPFGIGFTLVEPGPAGTSFKAGLVEPEPMADYAGTRSEAVRRSLSDGLSRSSATWTRWSTRRSPRPTGTTARSA